MPEFSGVLEYRGEQWGVLEVNRTSDGFTLAQAVLLDDAGQEVHDEDGLPVFHSFFLGR